jgi:hypothetical protein
VDLEQTLRPKELNMHSQFTVNKSGRNKWNIYRFISKNVCPVKPVELVAWSKKQKSFQPLVRLSFLCCRMSGIVVGNQREIVKDMVLADYQVPKGVSSYKSFRIWKLQFKTTKLIFKTGKTIQINLKICNFFASHNFS